MSSKADKKRLAAGAKDIHKARAAKTAATPADETKPSTRKPSWRDSYPLHPAAAQFDPLPPDELRELAKDIEANGLQVPIITVHVAGPDGGKTYMMDGRNRADAYEQVLGIPIVDEKGEWIGPLKLVPDTKPHVEHRKNYTNEKVAIDVLALNLRRRHLQLTKQEQVMLIDRVLRASNKLYQMPHQRWKKGVGGSAKDERKAAVIEQSKQAGISRPTAEKAWRKIKQQEQSEKAADVGRTATAKRHKGKQKKQKSLSDQVWAEHSKLLKHFGLELEPEVKTILHDEFLSDVCPAAPKREKGKRANSKLVSSTTWKDTTKGKDTGPLIPLSHPEP